MNYRLFYIFMDDKAIIEPKTLRMSDSFLNKVEQVISQHIENEKFGVSELAEHLNLSRSQILRKIKSSTGTSANQFIRDIRLSKALELLRNEELTVSEIAYNVGFGSPSYFNKCFQ